MKRLALVVLLILVVALLSSCAPGPNTAAGGEDVDGFWQGLWHGFITPVTFFVSLFNADVSIYEVANNGGWYDAGFLLGISIWGGGGGGACMRRRKRR